MPPQPNNQPFAFQETNGLETVAAFDDTVTNAQMEGVMPSNQMQHDNGQGLQGSRIRAMRTRLYLLGYLTENSGATTLGPELKAAITRFQQDAALVDDGWAGPLTWTALAQLVGFEEDTNLGHWTQPQFAALFDRALRLRIKVLGLTYTTSTELAIQAFVSIYNAYFAQGQPLNTAQMDAVYQALFDQEALLARIAATDDAVLAQPNVTNFIVAVAKIELWLLGYPVVPDGSRFVDENLQNTPQTNKVSLRQAMVLFWQDQGKRRLRAQRLSRNLDAAFFQALDLSDEGDQTEAMAGQLLHEPNKARTVWGALKKLGSRLWDGLRRAARWVGRFFNNAVRQFRKWSAAIARAVYGPAVAFFHKVKLFMQGLTYSIQFLFTNKLSNPPHLYVQRERDMDFRFIIPNDAKPEAAARCMNILDLSNQLLSINGQVVVGIINLLRATLRGITLGWIGLILALVKIKNKIVDLAQNFDVSVELFEQIRTLFHPKPA